MGQYINGNQSKAHTNLLLAYERGYRVDEDGTPRDPQGNVMRTTCSGGRDTATRYAAICFNIETGKPSATVFVHRLQGFLKYGDAITQRGMVIRHVNGDSMDNSWDNLELGTHAQNRQDIPLAQRTEMIKRSHATRRRNALLEGMSGYPSQRYVITMPTT